MKMLKTWKALTRNQKALWSGWAKNNPVLLDGGVVRRVSGRKAYTVVLAQRALAGVALAPTVVPAAVTWVSDGWDLDGSGPFTEGEGVLSLRAAKEIPPGTVWFVWATGPLPEASANPQARLRFITVLKPTTLSVGGLSADLTALCEAVNGGFDGPGEDGAWEDPTYVYFRIHQYANGALGPGLVVKGLIGVEAEPAP